MTLKHLFSRLSIGGLELPNRVFLAPLTRARAVEPRHLPNALMAEYYSQRASGGLVITECTMIQENTSAFISEPGIYNQEQVEAWKLTTKAVHEAGGKIFAQIWHGGRACHSLLNQGVQSVAPSPIAISNGQIFLPTGLANHELPRELRDDEIPGIIAAFKSAAENAKAAGFDGVELHAANGYLLDQFLRDGSNKRTGAYGGSLANRARLLFEVVQAVTQVYPAERVGVRISPLNSYNSMEDSDPVALTEYVAGGLSDLNIGYLHVMRADMFQQQKGDILTPARQNFRGVLISNMGYSAEEADADIAAGKIDAVAFGTKFLANPDLPKRFATGAALNDPNPALFYVGGAAGYTDYPKL